MASTIDETSETQEPVRAGEPDPSGDEHAGEMSPPAFAVASPNAPRARSRSRARRTRAEIRQVAPWSVLKFSLIFYFCLMMIFWVALVIIYLGLSAAGYVDSVARVLGYLFSTGLTSTKGPTPVSIDGVKVFTYLFFACAAFSVVWSLINVIVALIYNLISDVIGGVEITLADRNR